VRGAVIMGPASENLHNNGSERSYSITSSAIASIVGGTVRPSVLAVLEVDRQLEFCGLHDRQVGRFLP
jgi:hypothetical protein